MKRQIITRMMMLAVVMAVLGMMMVSTPSTDLVYAQDPTATFLPTTAPTTFGDPPPDEFFTALEALSTLVGETLTVDSFSNLTSSYEYTPTTFSNSALDCPSAGQTINPTPVEGWIINLRYLGVRYQYRIATGDPASLIRCTNPGAGTIGTTSSSIGRVVEAGVPGATCTTTRLQAGGNAQVLFDPPNRLRNAANGSTSTVIGLIPAGATVTLISGPTCDRGLLYWEVDYNGTRGFTAESEGSIYYLGPVASNAAG
jgi:hypothetical protein